MNIAAALLNWKSLNTFLMQASEEQCSDLLDIEKRNRNRESYVGRIHSRITILRYKREREELLPHKH